MSWQLDPDSGEFVEVDDGQEGTTVDGANPNLGSAQPTLPQRSSGGPSKVTYYGYEKKGDPDYDSNSASGKGDRENQLGPGSVALSRSERLARFGVTGKSTGLPVVVGGQTLGYDHDTSPQNFRNIDVYSPQGPGRNFKVWGQENGQPQQQQYPYDPNNDPFGNQQTSP